MSDAKVYEVKKLKFGHKAFTNYSNLWIDCKLELGWWTETEKANQDYIDEVVDRFKEYVKGFKMDETQLTSLAGGEA